VTPEDRHQIAALGGAARARQFAPHPWVGRRVIVLRSPRAWAIWRDEPGTVARVQGDQVRVQLDNGRRLWVRRHRIVLQGDGKP
jgi:hypothetical protein